jgi:predicted nuclease of restriction endonuclease-like (RecB) superfamily
MAAVAYEQILADIIDALNTARSAAARSVNMVVTATYWQIGNRIVEYEQDVRDRAAYGQALVERLAADLTNRFGRGFSKQNLYQMRQFRLVWTPEKILQTASGESRLLPALPATPGQPLAGAPASASAAPGFVFPLPWSAYVRLLSVSNPQAREFYETEALRNGWTFANSTARSTPSSTSARPCPATRLPCSGRAPSSSPPTASVQSTRSRTRIILEFLGLRDEYSETDLEDALLTHLADFLLELGDGFSFIARQRRMRIDDSWFRVDLLLFNRRLRCLVLVDLKIGRFSYTDAGQMHLYLNYARENWAMPGENPPVGLILCAEKGADEARYALDGLSNPVLAAEYKLALPDESVLAEELARTRAELERRSSTVR